MSHQRSLRLCVASVVAILLAATGCGKSLPDESDLPPEATLAYPGAVEVRRSFDGGEVGTYIDGGSADRSPRVNLTYELDGVTRTELFDWYESKLLERGWIAPAKPPPMSGRATGSKR